jgi:hypothetical protein
MTADQLAKEFGISRRIFGIRKKFPGHAPKDFNDLEEWRAFVDRFLVNRRVARPSKSNGQAAPHVAPAGNGKAAYDYNFERTRRTHIFANIDAIRRKTPGV